MKRALLAVIASATLLAAWAEAVAPRKWELRTREELLRGRFDGVSVSSDGTLTLAPKIEKVPAPQEEFYLSALPVEDGAVFLGTGHGGRIYRIGKDGQAELWFQAAEMDVTSLAQDKKGVLFAATSPNGRIYKITGKGKGEAFFDPAEKYIWDLLFMDTGVLWAAVGESGGIYVVSPEGQGRMVFKATENHILCLRRTARGDIIAGSGGGGLVYRLTAEGSARVLFETPYEEVRSLGVDRDGTLYVAASGTPLRTKKEEPPVAAGQAETAVSVTVTASASTEDKASAASATGRNGSALYRLSVEGQAKRLWSSEDEMIYALVLRDGVRQVLFGTGASGRIYALEADERASLIAQQSSEQIYGLVPLDSRLFVLANNPCELGRMVPEQRFSGEYTSPVLDAGTVASWGRLGWEAVIGPGASVQLQTRSGNTSEANATWSEWSPYYGKPDEPVLSPRARFLQVKVLLRSQDGKVSPVLRGLSVHYLQTNVAPAISRLELLPPNEVFLKPPDQDDVILGVERRLAEAPEKKDELRISIPAKRAERKGFRTIVWEAADDNGDTLTYSLAIRRQGEAEWRPLEEAWAQTVYAFDTLSFPDGTYEVRLTASDLPTNPPGLDLKTEKVLPALIIDNSLPVVSGFRAVRSGGSLEVSFEAEDAFSTIEEAKVLVRPGDWRVVFPVDGIADSRREAFKLTLKLPSGSDNEIAVRVRDSFGNVGVFRQRF